MLPILFYLGGILMIHLIIDVDNAKDFDFTNVLSNKSFKILYTQNNVIIQDTKLAQAFWVLFEKLNFRELTKGTCYLKRTILLAYTDYDLLFDNKKLIEIISQENKLKPKSIRSAIEYSIDSMYNFTSTNILKEVFGEDYNGDKLSLKDFIGLCVNYLNIATGKSPINMYRFN